MPFDQSDDGEGGGGGDGRHVNCREVSHATVDTMDTLCKMTDTCNMCTAKLTVFQLMASIACSNMRNRNQSLDQCKRTLENDIDTWRQMVYDVLTSQHEEDDGRD